MFHTSGHHRFMDRLTVRKQPLAAMVLELESAPQKLRRCLHPIGALILRHENQATVKCIRVPHRHADHITSGQVKRRLLDKPMLLLFS